MGNPHPEEINAQLWYGIGQAAYLVGLNRQTISNKSALGSKAGGLDFRVNPSNGRREYKGEELLRFLHREPPKPWRKYQRLGSKA